jgi:TonB-dependent starch-binding outer membrane protein SusC
MKSKFCFFMVLLFSFTTAMSQNKTVTGKVTSLNGEDISGATVTQKGTRNSVITDNNGKYSISVPNNKGVILVFSSVGNKTSEVNVGTKSIVNISMQTEASTLDEVVIGYQSVRRRDLLASVSSVSARDLKDIPINSAAEALNGRMAGVTATTSEGSPDAAITVRVRGGMSITGDNSPLYIIDGVQVENGLSTLSPQEIQSIDVLKDASATAIYGARGANGVIVITTKSGQPGKLKLSYNGYVGIKNLAKELDVLSPYDFVVYQSERSRGSSTDSTTFTNYYGTTWDTLSNYKNVAPVDWQKEVFGRTAFTQTHNVTASGGTKKFIYDLGYTYNDENAIVLNSKFVRNLLNFKGNYNIAKGLKAGISSRYMHQDVYGAGVSSDQGSAYNRLRNAVKYRPFLAPGQDVNQPDPFADDNVGNGLNLVNPLLLVNSEYRKKVTNAYNITLNASYTIVKNLTFKSTFGYDNNSYTNSQYSDSLTPYSKIQGGGLPIAELDTTKTQTITNSNVLTYSIKGFKQKHDFDFLVGEETYDLRTQTQNSLFKSFPAFTSHNDAFANTALGTPFTGYPRQAKARYTSLSFFSRINYSYLDKYLFSFNIRADGASKFAPGRQWGYFPAASFAWRVNNEKFMQNVKFINDLKFRVGFGSVGNNRIDDYLYLTTFNSDGSYYYGLNNNPVIAYYPASLVNPNLKWESTINRNYGVDISMFNNRLNMSVDLYDNSSDNLLLNVPIASTYGYSTQLQNVGKTSNRGVEVQIGAVIIRKKDFSWNANFNISANKNKVVALGPNQQSFFPGASWGVSGQPTDYIIQIGQPVGSMYGLVNDGFYKVSDFNYDAATGIYTLKPGVVDNSLIIGPVQPGSVKFKDLNGDDTVDIDHDRKIIGNAAPKFFGGLNQQFTYKRWDMSIFVNFSYGNDVYNANKIEFTNGYTPNSNLLATMKDRWKVVTPTGQTAEWVSGNTVYGIPPDQLAALNANAKIWQPLKSAGAFYPSSWAMEDGSFLRINNITIGYSLPVKSISKIKMTRLRLYVTANNLAVITNYTGYDPEVSVRSSPLTPGLDYSAYPKSRSFIFGVNATF